MSDLIAPIMGRYTNFTMTPDGIPEINSLSYVPFESGYTDPLATQRLILVLVEPRLFSTTGNPALQAEFLRSLQKFKGDLRAEGLISRFITANIYTGPVHKDGRVLLALRRFFRDVKSAFTNFEGVILIGNFPDATLVRTVAWCPGFSSPRQLAVWPELISERAEIVLSDLTGNWESIYQQNDFNAESITATPDAATMARGWFDGESVRNCEFSSSDFTITRSGFFRDAFFMNDAVYSILENRSAPSRFLRVRLNQAENNQEVDAGDRSMTNIIARPDITVSRLNAYHVAVNPNPVLRGTDGHTFLDAAGNPQTVTNPVPLFSGDEHLNLFNFKDFDLERRMLVNYFSRNHRFRNGAFSNLPFRTATITGTTDFSADGFAGMVNVAATDFQPDVRMNNASLHQYVQFHKTPAVLKYIMAHSNSVISQYHDTGNADVPAITAEVGGNPLRWLYNAGQYSPTFTDNGGNAEIYMHRAMWHYNTLQNAGASLIIHGGCNVNSIDETQTTTYASPNYARANNAECVLFFTNCVSLFSRAKGFNDAPNGFSDAFQSSDRANFGNCWKNYFDVQSRDAGLSSYNIQRKRGYFWSINGDWTLRLRNKNGLGILALDGSLRSVEVHPNRAWIDGWNFDAAVNKMQGIGDVDGDGMDEFVITSDWGIGIAKYTGIHFRVIMQAPRDTWFGGWRYDATINPGRDRIMGIQNYTGSAAAEILIWSSWGITALGFNGISLTPNRIFANGTRLGGWLINTADNRYWGCGQFDRDNCKDMVLTSPWGIGIISLQNSTHVFHAPNGTRFGGWLFNSSTDTIRLIADFDGDGRDEILITSPWGIGVLKMVGGALSSVNLYANGTNLNGYFVNNGDNFVLADNLKGGEAKEILVTNRAGLHMLALVAGNLQQQAAVANGSRIGGWLIDTSNNRFQQAGDMNGDGRAEFVIRSPWGAGVMGLDAANQFHCYSMFPYGTMLNDWNMQPSDLIVGSGNLSGTPGTKELLVLKPV